MRIRYFNVKQKYLASREELVLFNCKKTKHRTRE